MRMFRSLALAACLGILFAAPAWAGLVWLGAWDADLDMIVDNGTGSKRRTFGATATLDGDIKDLTADVAVACAEALASTNDINPAAASRWAATVDFECKFRLTEWTAGWSVNLQGLLSGRITNQHPEDDAASAVVLFSAALLDENRNPILTVGDGVTLNKAATMDLFRLLSETVHLASGDYFVTGEFLTRALVLPEPLRGDAAARFFDGGFAVSLSVEASEPPTRLLLLLPAPALIAKARYTGLRRPARAQ